MTYNFDPEKWYENERLRLERRRQTGELTEEAAAREAEALERRYEAIVARLDATFGVSKAERP